MKKQLIDLFEYHHSLNKELIGLFENHRNNLPDKVIFLYSHCINAHQIWNARIEETIAFSPFQEQQFEKFQELDDHNFKLTFSLLENRKLEDVIYYSSTSGEKYTNTIGEIFFHVINHYTHHKAQISALLSQNNVTPLKSDYILYKRK